MTGFLVNNVDEMTQSLHKVHTISPDVCRRVARRRFNVQRMVEEYFELYESCSKQRQRDSKQPRRERLYA